MSFRVQIEALRRHAAALEAESQAWCEAIPNKVSHHGDTDLSVLAFAVSGGELWKAYGEVKVRYAEHVIAAGQALRDAADLLRRAADAYGDTDAIIADTF